jgi:group I intron endonuclease
MGNPMSSVYWIHQTSHTDIFSQGYVGVSNDFDRRIRHHKTKPQNAHLANAINKYGWDSLVKKVVLIAEDTYCYDIEAKLRPTDKLGWNIVKGGGMPPSSKGKVFGPMSNETKAKVSAAKKGHRHTPEIEELVTQNLLIHGMPTRFIKGFTPWNKGGTMPAHVAEAISKANLGRKQSQEEKDKRAKSLMGHIVTQETRDKIRLKNLGKKPPMTGKHFAKIECPHCGKIGGLTAMPRWHFDNCKFKEQQ